MAKETEASVSARATRAAHEAIDQIGARGAQAEARLRDASTQVGDRSKELGREVSDYVSKNPLASVGIAVAAGFVLGALLRR